MQTIPQNQKYSTATGQDLTTNDLQNLSKSYLTRETVELAGIRRVTTFEGAALVGQTSRAGADYSGLAFPYYWPGDTRPREWRLRRDNPELERREDGSIKEQGKYLSPPGARNRLYIPPGTPKEWLTDLSIPVVITEGEKKALALLRFYQERGQRVLVIAISGVHNWRGVIGKITDDKGRPRKEKGVIPDFDRITWAKRRVTLIFDANVTENQMVQGARAGLAKELHRRAAEVFVVDLPTAYNINGVDDLLGLRGPDVVAGILDDARAFYPVFDLSDVGNSERLTHFHGDEIRYSYKAKLWLFYDGSRWRDDDHAKIERAAKATARRIYLEAGYVGDDPIKQEKIIRFAGKCQTRQKIESMLWLARSEVTREIDEFDLDPFSLNLPNGTVDLTTAKLKKHDAADYLSKIAGAPFIEGATCPRWLAFLDYIFDKNESLIRYVQKAVGYSLTGDISEQCLFICYGQGKNGKTVFLRTISGMMGKYGMNMPIESLMITRGDRGPREDIARLRGARMVTAAEAEDGQRLAESLVKQVTGGDTVTARFLFANSFEFLPEFKIWLGVNHRPVIRGTDEGIWRRLRLIPFSVTIPPNERRPLETMLAELREEYPGILNWALQGLHLKNTEGFDSPAEVVTATDSYREDSDLIGRFLNEFYTPNKAGEVGASALYSHFKAWAHEANEYQLTQTAFGRKLAECRRGGFDLIKGRDLTGHAVWRGIERRSDSEGFE